MSAASTALLRACSLLLCLVAGSLQISIKEFVVPKAVEVGNDAELRCQYELEAGETENALYVKWWWTPEASSSYDRKQIYQRIEGHPAEAIHHSNSSKIEVKDNDTIVLKEVTPVDSGTYECEVSNIEETRKNDKLIVFYLGEGPILNISEIEDNTDIENDLLLLECQADKVAPKPDVSISVNGKEIKITTIIEDDDHNGLYTVYANATHTLEDKEESDVRCEIFYSNADVVHPPYVDSKKYVPAGCDTHSTTEMPEDTTEPESTPESLQNSRDDGVRLRSSWVLLTTVVLLATQTIL